MKRCHSFVPEILTSVWGGPEGRERSLSLTVWGAGRRGGTSVARAAVWRLMGMCVHFAGERTNNSRQPQSGLWPPRTRGKRFP